MVNTITPDPDDIEALLAHADERVKAAHTLIKHEHYADAVSRAYYAFFDAASSALLSHGIVVKTHKGLIMLFR